MPGIDEGHQWKAVEPPRPPQGSDLVDEGTDLESLVRKVLYSGRLAELIAHACELGEMYFPPSHADPDRAPHPGVQAAIRAFAAGKQAEGTAMTREGPHLNAPTVTAEGPEITPLAYLGKWVAWSSDGMRILAATDTLEEAERFASAAGEPDPILQRPTAPHRP